MKHTLLAMAMFLGITSGLQAREPVSGDGDLIVTNKSAVLKLRKLNTDELNMSGSLCPRKTAYDAYITKDSKYVLIDIDELSVERTETTFAHEACMIFMELDSANKAFSVKNIYLNTEFNLLANEEVSIKDTQFVLGNFDERLDEAVSLKGPLNKKLQANIRFDAKNNCDQMKGDKVSLTNMISVNGNNLTQKNKAGGSLLKIKDLIVIELNWNNCH